MSKFVEFRHFHLFAGLGGGAKGFNKGQARVGTLQARFRCIGGVDSDPAAMRDFSRLAGVPGTVLDLFSREQYLAWHGHEPPTDWREATSEDIRRAAGNERPHIVFTSPPCKGFSGLLSEEKSTTKKYQALNALTVRGVWLTMEAWRDDPPELFILENVPRIANRGRFLLDQIRSILEAYGYAVAETTHDCGELGGLAESRRRFLLVARHQVKVPPFLYEPLRRPLRAVGSVLERLPLPGDPAAGPMHRVPALHWRTWVRLAFVEAGKDWRSLERLAVQDGYLADFGIVPETTYHNGTLGVCPWDEPTGTVTGNARPMTGRFSVADPRWTGKHSYGQLGVRPWDEPTGAVTGQSAVGGGPHAVADPRLGENKDRHYNLYRIIRWDSPANTITGATRPAGGGLSVADPRAIGGFAGQGKYRVTPYDAPTGTVIAGSTTGQGAFAVADPRPNLGRNKDHNYHTCGRHYGVVPWDTHTNVISGNARHDNGYHSVADPRLPEATDRGVFVIRAEDGTWHRPFTTLELAAIQSLIDPDDLAPLDGASDSAWRERIGNAVPPDAATAIAGVMGTTLLLAMTGETFVLSATPIWVRPIAIALAVHQPEVCHG